MEKKKSKKLSHFSYLRYNPTDLYRIKKLENPILKAESVLLICKYYTQFQNLIK